MLTDNGVLLFGSLLLCLLFLHRALQVKRDWQALGSLPIHSVLISPLFILNRALPRIPVITYGSEWTWRDAYKSQPPPKARFPYPAHIPYISCLDIFAASKSDIIQIRSLFPYSTPQLIIADATAAKVGRVVDL